CWWRRRGRKIRSLQNQRPYVGDERQHACKHREGSARKQPSRLPVQVSHEVVKAVTDANGGANHNQHCTEQRSEQSAKSNDERRVHISLLAWLRIIKLSADLDILGRSIRACYAHRASDSRR